MGFFCHKVSQHHNMPEWANHDMPVIIREFVHDDKGHAASVQYQALLVIRRMIGEAEHAGVWLGAKNVLNAPWSP